MKTSVLLSGLALCFIATVFNPLPVAAAESASITGILIVATDGPGETDARLKSYEPTLRRLFKFRSYEQIGRSRTSIEVPGKGVLNFGNEKLLIETTGNGKGSIRAKVQWRRGSKTMINTTVRMQPGVPTLLGGPKKGGGNGNLIVILVAD